MTNETDDELSEIQKEGMRAAWEKWNRGEMGDGSLTACQLAHEADRLSAAIQSPDMQPVDMVMVASSMTALAAALRRAETERDAQAKEFARFKAVAALANSVVRWDSLLNEMHEQKARAQRAEQERDAQAALVATLTAERDEARVVHACPPKGSGVMPCCGATPFEKQGERLTTNPALVTCDRQRLAADLDEARAQVWGLICVATNCAVS